jgi:lipopolysaccharide transport system permease protein
MDNNLIVNLWNYRHLTMKLAISDFKLRYKNSILGFLWSLIEPLLMLAVSYVVFTNLMKMSVAHYQLFLLAGIISWNMLSRGTSMGLNSILGKPSLVKKIYFPREILVVSSCITAFLMTLLEFVIFGLFMVIFTVLPTRTIIYFPLIIFAEFLLIVGLSLSLSVLNVYYRDIQYMWGVVLQIGFFATPVMYPISIFPEKYQHMVRLNPMTEVIDILRGSLIYSTQPKNVDTAFIIGSIFVIIFVGYIIFLRFEPRLAEEL